MAGPVRSRVLRHRDDRNGDGWGGHRPLWLGGDARVAAPIGPDDRLRPRLAEDGAGPAYGLRPDARAEMGHLHGRLRFHRGRVQQLRPPSGGGPDSARGRLHPRLPAEARGPAERADDPAGTDQGAGDHAEAVIIPTNSEATP